MQTVPKAQIAAVFSNTKRLSVLAIACVMLNLIAVHAKTQAQDPCWCVPEGETCNAYSCGVQPPEGGWVKTKIVDGNGVTGTLTFSVGPQGDWTWSGTVQGKSQRYDIDWFATCSIRSEVGQYFQFTSAGTLTTGENDVVLGVGWPSAGRARLAGRNEEIAAHWAEIQLGTWDCSVGSNPHDDGGAASDVIDGITKGIGIGNGIITIVAAII